MNMKRGIIMASFIASLLGLFSCNKEQPNNYQMADVYRDLRQQVLTLDPAKIGLPSSDKNQIHGVLMETGYPEAVATLVTIADGTVSLYFSNGGGIIGVGQHEGRERHLNYF
jgi:hypothetical protein